MHHCTDLTAYKSQVSINTGNSMFNLLKSVSQSSLTLSLFAHIEHNTAHWVTPSTVSFGFHSIWKVLFPHQNVINECLLCTQPHITGPWSYHLDIVYTLYQIIYLCHQAQLSWGRLATLCHDSVCSFYLFVIAFFVTLRVISAHLRSHGNRKIKQQ